MAKTDFEMVHYNKKNKIVSAWRTRNHQFEFEQDSINFAYGILDQIFKVLDEEDISVKQIIPCLATLKKVKMLLPTFSKNHTILWKKKLNFLKKPNWPWEITSWFLRKREITKVCWACGSFLPKSRYHNIYCRRLF